MTIEIGQFTFEGPYRTTDKLKDKSGVYAILCLSNEKYYPVDVGESSEVKSRVENHDRQSCWKRSCNSTLVVAVLYTPHLQQAGRREIEQKIRNQFDLPCGQR